jgi:hypothetical protein
MTRRKGEITVDLKRNWPHHVALSSEMCGALEQRSDVYRCGSYRRRRSRSPCTDENDFVVFGFANSKNEKVLCQVLRWGAVADGQPAVT